MPEKKSYLIDADVLIDYCKSDLSVLSLFSIKIGTLNILTTTLNEVKQLDEIICNKLDLSLIEPSEDHLDQAIKNQVDVSLEDYLCFLTAKSNNYILITNDRALRNLCVENDTTVLWGLEVLFSLCKFSNLPLDNAKSIAEQIHKSNPFRITNEIIERFYRKLKNLSRK